MATGIVTLLGRLGIAGGVVILLLGAGSAVVGVTTLLKAADPPEPLFFSADEPVSAPDPGLLDLGPLVVYGDRDGIEGSITQAMGCVLLSSSGEEARLGIDVQPALETERGRLESLVSTLDSGRGGSITCSGPGAAAAEPLALATGQGTAVTAGVVALVLSVVALGFGAACLVTGLALRRRRRPSQ